MPIPYHADRSGAGDAGDVKTELSRRTSMTSAWHLAHRLHPSSGYNLAYADYVGNRCRKYSDLPKGHPVTYNCLWYVNLRAVH